MKKVVMLVGLLFAAHAVAMDTYETRVKQASDMVVISKISLQLAMYNTKLALMKCNDDQHDLLHSRSLIQDSLYPELGKGEILAHGIAGTDFVPMFLITFTTEAEGTKIQSFSHKALINLGGGMHDTTKNIDKLARDGEKFDCTIINGSRETQKSNNRFGQD